MTKIQRLFLLVFLAFQVVNAHADIFMCKDSSGHLITSDRAVPECTDKTTQVYTNSGVFKDQLPGVVTSEQKRAAELQEQRRAQEALEQEKQRKEQRYLMAHYPSEQDVDIARKKELSAIETKIATEQQTIQEATEAINNYHREQVQLPKNQNGKLMDAIDELRQTIGQSNRLIERYTAEKASVNRKFDETHKRYIEVLGSSKK